MGAIVANYRTFSSVSDQPVAAVVKANAYGLGMTEVARALAAVGCDTFFVATPREGASLRASLGAEDIYVLEGFDGDLACFTAHALRPVLNTLEQIDAWGDTGPAAVMVDTGMQRLGLAAQDVPQACTRLGQRPELLLTHFARADEVDHAATAEQIEAFARARTQFEDRFGAIPISVANSPAGVAGTRPDGLVRAGIGLYGGNPFLERENPFLPAVELTGEVIQVRSVEAESPVGYGGTFVAQSDRTIAVVNVGYADGLPRLLSNQGHAFVAGVRAPIVGRVSMDMVHVDVTGLDEIGPGTRVELIGSHIGVDEVARHAQTIGYEVLTGLNAAGRLQVEYVADVL